MARPVWLVFLLAALPVSLCNAETGSEGRFRLDHLGVDEGLSNNTVSCIAQDSRGFVWFGTQDGLNRYDGFSFRIYRHDPADSTTLSDYAVNAILEDPLQPSILWIGTRDGLSRFDRATETFTRFRHDPKNPGSLSDNRVRSLCPVPDGSICIGTDNGVSILHRDRRTFTSYPYVPDDSHRPSVRMALVCLCDDAGNIWIGGSGLDRFDPRTGTFTHTLRDPSGQFQRTHDRILSLCRDSPDRLRAGTLRGLFLLDTRSHDTVDPLVPFPMLDSRDLGRKAPVIRSLMAGSRGLTYAGTQTGEVIAFGEQTGMVVHRLSESDAAPVVSVFEDASGVVWLGTGGQGVYRHDAIEKQFRCIGNTATGGSVLPGNEVTALSIDGAGNWWIGTSTGLGRRDARTGKITRFVQEPRNASSLSNDDIQCAFMDLQGELWIGTWGGGVNRMDPATGRVTRYMNRPDDPRSLSSDYVHTILEDRNRDLWIGTGLGGLERFDRNTSTFVSYGQDEAAGNGIGAAEITCLLEDHDSNLWVGTSTAGLHRIDQRREKVTHFRPDPRNSRSIRSNRINCLFEDASHVLWAGTFGGGLNRFDRATESFSPVTVDNGLASNTIAGIVEDRRGILWVSTDRGLSRFDRAAQSIRNFYANDGLVSHEFNVASVHCADDAILLGTNRGIVFFHPDSIRDNPFVPPVVLTDVRVFNVSVDATEAHEGRFPQLDRSVSEAGTLELLHDQNAVTFEFAALHFASPFKNRYAFMLENFDKAWTDAGTRRYATYTNLDPGEYVFRVTGTNGDGVWNQEGRSIAVVIHPPWWKSTAAYIGYALLIAVTLLVLRFLDIRRIQVRNQLRMKEFETAQLRDVDRLKSEFFTNVSHEFRTPLTLIVGPLDDLIGSETSGQRRSLMEVMRRNAARLLQLVNQLLDIARLESGQLPLRPAPGDLRAVVSGVVYSFSSLADQRNISYVFDAYGLPATALLFDQDMLEKILANLLGNAFKYTPDGGQVTVGVSFRANGEDRGTARLAVANTGRGIPAAHLPHIFDRFYRVDETDPGVQEGTGIGLALVKQLVERHNGTISATSVPDQSTEFVVELHLETSAPEGEPIAESVRLADAPEDGIGPEVTGAPESASAPSREVVLVVEDHAEVRRYIRGHLESTYQVVEAVDGRDGLRQAIAGVPDLVISDVMMPGMDGFRLCHELKTNETTSHVPVLLLTARASDESRLEGLETGADDYLVKPFHARELIVRVANLLRSRAEMRRRFREEVMLRPNGVVVTSANAAFVKRVMAVIELHLGDDAFGVQVLSDELAMTTRQLHRKLTALVNQSPNDFIRTFRLTRARQLIEQEAGSISEIAYQTGFRDPSYFSRVFREQFGFAPSAVVPS